MLRNAAGELLLCELTYKKEWDLPGGVVDPGESPATCVEREVREELGLTLTAGAPGRQLAARLPWLGRRRSVPLRPRHLRDDLDPSLFLRREIKDAHWVAMIDVDSHLAPYAARMLASAAEAEHTAYPRTGGPVSKRSFWIALGLAFAALFLLPSFFVGLLAVVNGWAPATGGWPPRGDLRRRGHGAGRCHLVVGPALAPTRLNSCSRGTHHRNRRLPNVGKSTMFNALTKNNVLAANYPFATIEPNVGVVPLPDARLTRLAEIFGSEKILPATVSFVDIAGIAGGASEGGGLGNKFLANIREADAICQVVRAFEDGDVVHVDGRVSPESDIETIHTELIPPTCRPSRRPSCASEKESRIKKESKPAYDNAVAAQKVLEEGKTCMPRGRLPGSTWSWRRGWGCSRPNPFIYVFNLDEDQLADTALHERLAASVAPADAVFLNAKLEMDLMDMSPEDQLEMLEGFGASESGWISWRTGFHTLGLQTYLTAGPQGVAGLDDPSGLDGAAGGGGDPHRLPEGLHQGRGGVLSTTSTRPDRWLRSRPAARRASRARTT